MRALVFDLDNTLYPYKPAHEPAQKALIRAMSERLQIAEESVTLALKYGRNSIHNELHGLGASHSRLFYVQRALESLGRFTPGLSLELASCYWEVFFKNMHLTPLVMPTLLLARARGFRIGLVTDLTAEIQFAKLKSLGLEAVFDAVVTSEEAGKEKPHPWPIILCLRKLGCIPEQAVMIGDSVAKDLGAAKAAGLFTTFLIGSETLEGHTTLPEVGPELISLIEKLNWEPV